MKRLYEVNITEATHFAKAILFEKFAFIKVILYICENMMQLCKVLTYNRW